MSTKECLCEHILPISDRNFLNNRRFLNKQFGSSFYPVWTLKNRNVLGKKKEEEKKSSAVIKM